MIKLNELCFSVCEIVEKAANFIAEERDKFDETKIESKGLHDLVSYVDREAEKLIISQLQKLLPEAGFIAEEGTIETKGERFNWVIDPLDGTTNFIQGVPVYAVSIGLIENDAPVLGVVYEIGRKECFYAWTGGGAFLNGKQIHVSQRSEMSQVLLVTGFPFTNFDSLDKYLNLLEWCMRNTRGIRSMGSAATDMAYVASGRFDAFWESGLKPWDAAAGIVLMKEAGGIVSDFEGEENYLFGKEMIASNSFIAQLILNKLREYMK